jgi:assimilatory nitrate reductase catalytic subunit
VRLPVAGWGEKDGTVTNSERRISRQRAFLPLPGDARPDWWIVSEVARRLGFAEAFAYSSAADIFDEHARLSGFENRGARAFDISGLAGMGAEAFHELTPRQWPARTPQSQTERLFADGQFFTPDRKARFVAIRPPRLSAPVSVDWPFVLNSGRVRDQWHTMTRTGLSPRLLTHIAEPFVEIHPDDAAELGLEQGRLADVTTEHGTAVLRVLVNRGQQPGTLFVPIHWSAENSSCGRVGAIVQPATDPFSGQPESKATPARIVPRPVTHYGFVLSRQRMLPDALAYWAHARASFGHVLNFALDEPAVGWVAWLRASLPDGQLVSLSDAAGGTYRAAIVQDDRLEVVLFVAKGPKLPAVDWLKSRFDEPVIAENARRDLLAGRPVEGAVDDGPTICVCFQVGAKRIEEAIAAGHRSVEKIGRQLGAGTNCGSCIPEIRRLIGAKKVAHEFA